MSIKTISLTSLQNMEHYQFAGHVLAMCEEANIEKLNPLIAPLQKAFNDEDKALNLPRQEEGTKELEELDRERDTAYRSLQLLIDLHLHSDDAAMRRSAERLSEVMSRYPKLASANYDKESGMVKNLVTDLRANAIDAHVAKLAAKPYITRLDVANDSFDRLYRSRLKGAIPSGAFDIKALRAATDKALNAVVRRMDSLDDLAPDTLKLPELIKQYNALVDKRRKTLAHRSGTSQTAREKRTAEYEALLKPGLEALEQRLNLEKGSLSFTGKTEGTGSKRHYQLSVKGQTGPDGKPKTIWVGVNKDGSLYMYEKTTAKPVVPPAGTGSTTGEQP